MSDLPANGVTNPYGRVHDATNRYMTGSAAIRRRKGGAWARPLDLLVAGAHVWTGDPGRPRASALGVRGGRVAFVGPAEEARLLAGAETDIVEAAGKLLVPGFIDAHNHVRLGSSPLAVDLGGAASLEELKARVRAHAEAHPGQAWVEGAGWNYPAMPGGRLPTWADLEGVTAGKPALLFSYDGHNVWLNREAGPCQASPRHDPAPGAQSTSSRSDAHERRLEQARRTSLYARPRPLRAHPREQRRTAATCAQGGPQGVT